VWSSCFCRDLERRAERSRDPGDVVTPGTLQRDVPPRRSAGRREAAGEAKPPLSREQRVKVDDHLRTFAREDLPSWGLRKRGRLRTGKKKWRIGVFEDDDTLRVEAWRSSVSFDDILDALDILGPFEIFVANSGSLDRPAFTADHERQAHTGKAGPPSVAGARQKTAEIYVSAAHLERLEAIHAKVREHPKIIAAGTIVGSLLSAYLTFLESHGIVPHVVAYDPVTDTAAYKRGLITLENHRALVDALHASAARQQTWLHGWNHAKRYMTELVKALRRT
jgi:hypothetical protein